MSGLEVTPAAAREIRAAAERSGAAGMALRVGVRLTRDGPAYAMGFDAPAADDAITVFEGLTVVVAAASQPLLAGTVLDYVELDAGGRDFIFVPPAAAAGGCATAAAACGSGRCAGCS